MYICPAVRLVRSCGLDRAPSYLFSLRGALACSWDSDAMSRPRLQGNRQDAVSHDRLGWQLHKESATTRVSNRWVPLVALDPAALAVLPLLCWRAPPHLSTTGRAPTHMLLCDDECRTVGASTNVSSRTDSCSTRLVFDTQKGNGGPHRFGRMRWRLCVDSNTYASIPGVRRC